MTRAWLPPRGSGRWKARAGAAIAAALVLSGCASVDPYASPPISAHLGRSDDVGDCARLLRALDAIVDAAAVRDASAPRVPGFPYLRADRFTASLGEQAAALRGAGFAAWSELMAHADRQARAVELANAGAHERAASVDACRYMLAIADGGEFERLRAAARVPDDYSVAMRTFGLYPVTRLAFAAGIRDWQRQTLEVYATPLDQLPVEGRVRRYVPASSPPAIAFPPRSAVLLPPLSRPELAQWIVRHAPVLEIDTASVDDRIGELVWSAAEAPAIGVDPERPAAYVRATYAHFAGRVRLQLVYSFWFPARPATGRFDILAGRLDGILWRVTLDESGAPLVYDSIHPCGCWHLFFPTERVTIRPRPATLDEGLFAPQWAPSLAPGERIVLRVAARTHELQRVFARPAPLAGDAAFDLLDERALLTLAWPAGGTRSAYDAAGFVPGTERAERWLYWPMGIASAGQMRQWGRHATAFVGRRHFDDAGLLDLYFTPRAAGLPAAEQR
jgi:hypothetical protein